MERGYIKLWRRSVESCVFQDPARWKVWLYFLMIARHKDGHVLMRTGKGQRTIELKKGELVFGRHKVAAKLNMPPSTVRNIVDEFHKKGMVDIKPDSHFSILSICNFDLYNDTAGDKGQPRGHPMDTQRTGNGHPMDTNKNYKHYKNVKNEKKKENGGKPPPRSKLEVSGECLVAMEKEFPAVDVKAELILFHDYIKAHGKKYKDYDAAFRNRIRNPNFPKAQRVGGNTGENDLEIEKLKKKCAVIMAGISDKREREIYRFEVSSALTSDGGLSKLRELAETDLTEAK